MPKKYGRDNRNVNPPLTIEHLPAKVSSLVLILDDPDAVEPTGKVWLHWLVWNVPPSRTEVPENWQPENAVEGTNDFGNRGYDGPAPPDESHTYRFKLYALDTSLDLLSTADKQLVGEAMRNHRLSQTQLTGTFEP